ncbi:hypothetical protein [Bradyrhizobium iriomotense]|uniref:Uncharacterized protein n=1 Tax=Bradyrhizobium iriomotense TaxID=441950 RepID=A0ABQ6BAE5_9BRAD|nr:hypothetical protein [Bradyrhizobium iriomotense]GLR89601.1 hypothetical protein GCM10007857_63150 [Bradyrhizobium iriomotense]
MRAKGAVAIFTAVLALVVSLYTLRKTGTRSIAAFQQQWIDTLRKTLSEYHSILMTTEPPLSSEDDRKVSNLGTQIELMLNPDDEASQKLEKVMDVIYHAETNEERVAQDPAFVAAARRVLKDEWKRVKSELK